MAPCKDAAGLGEGGRALKARGGGGHFGRVGIGVLHCNKHSGRVGIVGIWRAEHFGRVGISAE